MPDASASSLERALRRERLRREQAERLLEDKSRELFESYQSLKTAHEDLRQNQKQLLQSEKMASLGTLSAGVAHEINNPVGFVLSNVSTLAESLPVLMEGVALARKHFARITDGHELAPNKHAMQKFMDDNDVEYLLEDLPELIEESRSGLVRIRDIVDGLKSFSRADDSSLSTVDVNECVKSAMVLATNQIKHKGEVTQCLQAQRSVSANDGRLTQVILNLLVNAGQAIPNQGEILVSTNCVEDEVTIAVGDNGCGISPANIDKLFTPFFTTKPPGEGTGLGLSISFGIIEEFGGRIDVESEEGVGTTFTITLPASA